MKNETRWLFRISITSFIIPFIVFSIQATYSAYLKEPGWSMFPIGIILISIFCAFFALCIFLISLLFILIKKRKIALT